MLSDIASVSRHSKGRSSSNHRVVTVEDVAMSSSDEVRRENAQHVPICGGRCLFAGAVDGALFGGRK